MGCTGIFQHSVKTGTPQTKRSDLILEAVTEGHCCYQRTSQHRKHAVCNIRNERVDRKELQLHSFVQLHMYY